jgi:hypothetical protein
MSAGWQNNEPVVGKRLRPESRAQAPADGDINEAGEGVGKIRNGSGKMMVPETGIYH